MAKTTKPTKTAPKTMAKRRPAKPGRVRPKAQPIAAARREGRGALTGRSETVGIRMTPQMEADFKGEATRRGLSLADLFDEMWGLYRGRGGAGARRR